MSVSIIEDSPGAWRWVFHDASRTAIAWSKAYPSPQACWRDLTLLLQQRPDWRSA